MPQAESLNDESIRKSRIWTAAGIGCGGLALFILIGIVIILMNLDSILRGPGDALRVELQSAFETFKAEGKVPAEHLAAYEDLLSRALRPDSGMFAPGMVSGVIMQTLDDGAVTDDELILVRATLDFLESFPAPNPIMINQYMERHPELAETVKRLEAEYSKKP